VLGPVWDGGSERRLAENAVRYKIVAGGQISDENVGLRFMLETEEKLRFEI
jgi:hypothetical protein